MALTSKDLHIINTALAFYQAEIDTENTQDLLYQSHKTNYGDPVKTIEATRLRIFKEMAKKEVCA